VGRPGLAPGIYFRLLMVGYFEGIDSERGIAWRGIVNLGRRETFCFAMVACPGIASGRCHCLPDPKGS
jgi:hypothetical protein